MYSCDASIGQKVFQIRVEVGDLGIVPLVDFAVVDVNEGLAI